jgi:hypothetical protein
MAEKQGGQKEPKLQPLDFKPFQVDGPVTVYRAIFKDNSAPGSPEFALTASIATSIFREAKKDFIVFLRKMRASFELLSRIDSEESEESEESYDGDDDPDDEESGDIGTQIGMEPSLLSVNFDGLFDASVTAQTSVGPDDSVGPYNNNHYWLARGQGRKYATVTSDGGSGQIWRPKGNTINVYLGQPGNLWARKVNVHSDAGMSYTFQGSFDGPYAP